MRGHLQRVRARVQPVAVQVSDSLVAAIGVLAPSFGQPVDLSAEMAAEVPPASPEPEFRANLHVALERAHRQHTAQRMLGTRGAAPQRRTRRWVWALALAALAGLLWFWWAHNRAARPAADPATD
jgi:hypothetical protein